MFITFLIFFSHDLAVEGAGAVALKAAEGVAAISLYLGIGSISWYWNFFGFMRQHASTCVNMQKRAFGLGFGCTLIETCVYAHELTCANNA